MGTDWYLTRERSLIDTRIDAGLAQTGHLPNLWKAQGGVLWSVLQSTNKNSAKRPSFTTGGYASFGGYGSGALLDDFLGSIGTG